MAGGSSVRGAKGSVARKRRYQDVMDFMEKNHRNPSRHRLEEHDMLNWVKQQ